MTGEAPGESITETGKYKLSKIIKSYSKSIPFASMLGRLRKSVVK